MAQYIIMQASIPMNDLGDIEIITSADDEVTIRQKITQLHNRMLEQIACLKQWHQQGGVLTPSQVDKLVRIPPMITAYFTQQGLYHINKNVSSMGELSCEFHKYTESIHKAIAFAKESKILDENIITWIKTKFTQPNV